MMPLLHILFYFAADFYCARSFIITQVFEMMRQLPSNFKNDK